MDKDTEFYSFQDSGDISHSNRINSINNDKI